MKVYTLTVDASFSFDVNAENEAEALAAARALLATFDPVTDYGSFDMRYTSPWVAPARADERYPSLEVTDVM